MAVIGVEIKNQSEFDSGTSWGEFGVYERIDGVVFLVLILKIQRTRG